MAPTSMGIPSSDWRARSSSANRVRRTCSVSAPGPLARRKSLDRDRKSTRLNSSHGYNSYAVFCLIKNNLSHLGFLAGQIGRLITISTTPVIAGDSFEMDAVGALRLSPLRRGLAIDSTVDICTFYVPHRLFF